MNGLYQLQQQLWQQEEAFLSINPLRIRLGSRSKADKQQLSAENGAQLRDYYLDWRNYEGTTDHDVRELLAAFWQRLDNQQGRNGALQALNLGDSASADQITQRYRELATRHHPDKGGDPDRFIQIRQAYELLMSTH